MKHFLPLLLLLFVNISFEALSQSKKIGNQEFSFASGEWYKNQDGESYKIDTEVITIKFKTDDIGKFLSKYGLSIVRKSPNGYYDIQVPKNLPILEIAEQIHKESFMIESIDVNTYGEYSFSPNDTQFSNQWYLTKIGMVSGWDKVRGNNCTQIAIIDSGVDIAHEDIGRGVDTYDNLWRNIGEDAWTDPNNPATGNGIDNDGNGLVDDWRGWDFVNLNNDVRSPGNTHGTRVAGIVSAKLNNNRGISGIGGGSNNTGLQLMILGAGELAPSSAALDDAILYAVQNGADVIQMSLTVAQTAAIDNAIQTAINNGIPVVCASGNNNTGVSYPANNANVIAVGSTNQNDQKSSFSNFGTELFISAPGEQIRSTQLNNTYGDSDGTSFSAPQVSSVIGLIRSISPNLTVQQIRNILSSTADKVGGVNYNWDPNRPGHSRELGFGRLNANAALNSIFPNINGLTLVCTSGSFTLQNQPPGTTVTWSSSSPSGLSINSTTGAATRQNNFNGQVTVTAMINSACGNTNFTRNVWVGVPVNVESIALGFYTNQPFYVCPNTTYQFNAFDFTNIPGTTYNWYTYNNHTIQSGQGTISTNIRTGNFVDETYISVRAQNTCGGSSWTDALLNQDFTCGSGWGFSVSPNPSSDYIELNYNGAETDILNYEVGLYDWNGQVLYKERSNSKKLRIQTSSFKKGLIVLKIVSGNKSETQLIQIEK